MNRKVEVKISFHDSHGFHSKDDDFKVGFEFQEGYGKTEAFCRDTVRRGLETYSPLSRMEDVLVKMLMAKPDGGAK